MILIKYRHFYPLGMAGCTSTNQSSLYSDNECELNYLLGENENTVLEDTRCINCGFDYCGCWR